MRLIRCLLVGLVMVAIAGGVWAEKTPEARAAKEDMKKLPGFVEFDARQILGQAEPDVNVFLEEALLKAMAGAIKADEPELADLLGNVKLIQVQVFKGLTAQEEKSLAKISELVKTLKEKDGWYTGVSVRGNGQTVDIVMKMANGSILGLALFVARGTGFVFINIAGEFEAELLGSKIRTLIDKFSKGNADLSQLGTLLESISKKSESNEPSLIITGTVKDAATGQPIEGAKVSDDQYGPEPYKGAATDAAGKYRYVTWPEEHNIIAEAPGYKAQRRGIQPGLFQKEKEMVVDFALERE